MSYLFCYAPVALLILIVILFGWYKIKQAGEPSEEHIYPIKEFNPLTGDFEIKKFYDDRDRPRWFPKNWKAPSEYPLDEIGICLIVLIGIIVGLIQKFSK